MLSQVKFWKRVRNLGQQVDVMIPPHLQGDLVEFLSNRGANGLSMNIVIEDVQKYVAEYPCFFS